MKKILHFFKESLKNEHNIACFKKSSLKKLRIVFIVQEILGKNEENISFFKKSSKKSYRNGKICIFCWAPKKKKNILAPKKKYGKNMQKTYAFFGGGQLQSQNFPKNACYLGKCIFLAYVLHIFDFLRKMVENGKICKKYAKKFDFGVAPQKKCIFCLHIFHMFFGTKKNAYFLHIFGDPAKNV